MPSPLRFSSFLLSLLFVGAIWATGCEPQFTDEACQSDFQCFANEICVAGSCEPRPAPVPQAPAIGVFEASAEQVERGTTVTLRWETERADALELTQDGTPLALETDDYAAGQIEVTIEATAEFRLVATNAQGSDEASLTVEATEPLAPAPPEILEFNVPEACSDIGATVRVSWKTQYVVNASVVAGLFVHEIPAQDIDEGHIDIPVETDTSVVLNAFNDKGMAFDERAIVLCRPTIERFEAETPDVVAGDPLVLSWEVEGADSVAIEDADHNPVDLGGADAAQGQVTVHPLASTAYTLTATNANGSVEETIEVDVIERLVITSFEASADTIRVGESLTLTWKTEGGAETITLEDDQGHTIEVPQDADGSVVVTPTDDVTYTLTVSNDTQTREAELSVEVLPLAPAIARFDAAPALLVAGDTARLGWQVEGATALAIEDDLGQALDLGSVSLEEDGFDVTVERTTTFTLRATNRGGESTATATVAVGPPVAITTFEATTPTDVDPGGTVTLRWATVGAAALTLDRSIGGPVDISARALEADEVTVQVFGDTTFTLTAQGLRGPVTSTVDVRMNRPTIASFAASPTHVVEGGVTTLSWQTAHATSLELTSDRGDSVTLVAATGSIALNPTADTVYTLTATNAFGSATQTATVTTEATLAVDAFAASAPAVVAGDPVTLSWQVSGMPTEVTLYDMNGMIVHTADAAGRTNGQVTLSPTVATTYTLRATTALQSVASTPVTVGMLDPVVIDRFVADELTVTAGSLVLLSWETRHATGLTLRAGDDAVDLTGLSIADDTIALRPQASTTYTLTAAGPGGPVEEAVTVTVTPAPLEITEVFHNPAEAGAGLQWVEIHNPGDTFVDLSHYALVAGDGTLALSLQLEGWIAPGGCFVVGGPTSSTANHSPAFDQAAAFDPLLQDDQVVALAMAPAGEVTGDTDVFGGFVLMGTTPGASVERLTGQLLREQAAPSPGHCARLLTAIPGPDPDEPTIVIYGHGLDVELDAFALGTLTDLECVGTGATNVLCDVPPTDQVGTVDLVVTRAYTYAPDASGDPERVAIDAADRRSITLPAAYTFEVAPPPEP